MHKKSIRSIDRLAGRASAAVDCIRQISSDSKDELTLKIVPSLSNSVLRNQ